MHKSKSSSDSSLAARPPRRKAGFSLIEVSMALAIVAIAFVALIGLLPAGMKVFEASMNTTAQTRMVSHLTSLLQSTDYKKFREGGFTSTLYYYDVDGSYLDSDASPVAGLEDKRIYAAKILLDSQNVPNSATNFDQVTTATRVVIAMGRNELSVTKDLSKYTKPADLAVIPVNLRVKAQAILIARMDLETN